MKTIEEAALKCNKEYSKQQAPAYIGFTEGVKYAQSDIPVEVELPIVNLDGESDLILMKVGNSYYTGNYINGDWVGNDGYNQYDPTHWRPINYK